MDLLSPSRLLDKSPLKDVTNSTPTPGIGSPRKITKLPTRSKRSNSTTTTTAQSPQRRSTRLNSSRIVDLNDKPEKEQDPQSVTTTRSRRSKVTPKAGEGVTVRKRGGRRETSEGSVVARRTRRSISTIPSSPLAGKGNQENPSTPKRPRITRSMSMSAKTETSNSSHKHRIPVINETDNESYQQTSPLQNYHDNRQTEIPQQPETPFKQYPLPISPIKSTTLRAPIATPRQQHSPLPPFSGLKRMLGENDIFAISPAMFPSKTKRVDYLDFLADADRKDFTSPIKTVQERAMPSQLPPTASPVDPAEPEDVATCETAVVEMSDSQREMEDVGMSNVEVEEEHPHFALLAYLAEVASVRDPLPEERDTVEEEVTHGSIEDILTAAALAESMKEEIFIVDEDDVAMAEEDEDVDIMTLPGRMPDEEIEENQLPVTESVDESQYEMTASPAKSILENVTESPRVIVAQNSVDVTIVPSQAPTDEMDANAKTTTTAPIEAVETLGEDDQDDWESLISYSEAEDNTVDQPSVQVQHTSSVREILPTDETEEMNDIPIVPSPVDTVGLDEIGQFALPQINFFEDPSETDQPTVQTRLSLDRTTILSFSTHQNLVTSPPKRQSSAVNHLENNANKKRKTNLNLPNTTRLDILRKRATRVRSQQARHGIPRRDFSTALQPVLDTLPSPSPKRDILRNTPALLPPSFVAKRLQSPVTPAPTKRRRVEGGDDTLLMRSPSPGRTASLGSAMVSPRKHIAIKASPVKGTPRGGFKFVFESLRKSVVTEKTTPRYEVYSKMFGPPPQLQKQLVEKDTTSKPADSLPPTQSLDTEILRQQSPQKARREIDPAPTKKRAELETLPLSTLGKPLRNESFAVPTIPVPPGPPQLPPTTQRTQQKRFAASVLPSQAQPPPSVARSSLPRRAGTFGSALPVPSATRRSSRVPPPPKPAILGVKAASATNAATTSNGPIGTSLSEKKAVNGIDHTVAVIEKVAVPPVIIPESTAPPSLTENVTMDRPKGKLGGAQRVNRNGSSTETKKVVEAPTRPTRPPTPPLTSLSQKELKSLTDVNTKKNEGFKTVSLQPTVKRVNKKRPGEASDDFMIGKGAKWSKTEALPDWDRDVLEDGGTIKWKSPRFMAKTERRGAMRVKGILKKKERERLEKEDDSVVGGQCEPLVVQRFVYKGEK